MSATSGPSGPLVVPAPWRGDKHLLAMGFPFEPGAVCPLTGDWEDRSGVATFRYCEISEMDRAIDSAKMSAPDWAEVGVYRYDPKSTDYVRAWSPHEPA